MRTRCWIRHVSIVVLVAPGAIAIASEETRARARESSGFVEHVQRLCPTILPATQTRRYRVSGRVRPLLFWTGRRDVGEATVTWRGDAGQARGIELLIGTDPGRAPMRMNRWGYVAETTCPAGTDVVGLMTQSDEETIDEARVNLTNGRGAGHPFRAIRARVAGDRADTEVLRVVADQNFTYRDLDALLSRLPAPGATRRAPVASGAASGFLLAMIDLLRTSATDTRKGAMPATPLRRAYVYAGRPYEMVLRSARVLPAVTIEGRAYERPIEGEFEVHNRTTREVTTFAITFGTVGEVAEVPLRIVYRPKWWVELDLALQSR